MEAGKREKPTFLKTLHELYERTGRIEVSFASKLVATLDPEKPVIDQFVLANFNLTPTYRTGSDREGKALKVYSQLCAMYETFITSPEGQLILTRFRDRYPKADVTDTKRIDLVLWQIR